MDQCTDLFTQRMLQRTEQRSKALGISNAAKYPLIEFNQTTTTTTPRNKPATASSPRKTQSPHSKTGTISKSWASNKSPSKQQQQQQHVHRVESKENCDLALEINITTGPNVQVQVEVEEREIDCDGNILQRHSADGSNDDDEEQQQDDETIVNNEMPMIRDSSRNRLQRLGALYSETENLSSPINRNESRFLIDDEVDTPQSKCTTARQTTRTGKLAALANSIKTWEDDLSHPDVKHREQPARMAASAEVKPVNSGSPKKTTGTIPKNSRPVEPAKMTKATQKIAEPMAKKSSELKWDQHVMDALEQQGFTRRESTTSKLTYDYKNGPDTALPQTTVVTKTVSTNVTTHAKSAVNPSSKPPINVAKGLVSGRAAIFENAQPAASGTAVRSQQKDPAEMSLKDRMALFERNKGNALIPKASFGMAAPSKQIETVAPAVRRELRDYNAIVAKPTEVQTPKIDAYNQAVLAESKASGNCIKSTVAALMSKGATLSAAEISQDVRKQREREMNVLLNRFNKPDSSSVESVITAEPQRHAATHERARHVGAVASSGTPPPVPPPMPTFGHSSVMPVLGGVGAVASNTGHVEAKCVIKRKSGEKDAPNDDSNQHNRHRTAQQTFDETKRKKVAIATAAAAPTTTTARLYPVLSDIESTTATESDADNCTTATVSSDNDQRNHRYRYQPNDSYEVDEDSFMDSEDADTSGADDLNNISLGREIMQAVKRNDLDRPPSTVQQKRNVVFDSSTSDISDAVYEMDDYLNEALDEDEEEEKITPKKGSISSNSFSYARSTGKSVRQQTIAEDDEIQYEHKSIGYDNPITSELKVNPSDDNNIVTLTHTVSFYRRQQSQSVNNTPVRKVNHDTDNWRVAPATSSSSATTNHSHDSVDDENDDPDDEDDSSARTNDYGLVDDKVKRMLEEIRKQEQIMSQTSQALNLCAVTVEFSGSTEAVEGERHLLVASHRRQAALNEVQRLRVERCLRPIGSPADRGKLIVREITVPLQQQYKDMLNMETICGHHLVCLLKYNETVVATKTVPTLPGLLAVKFPDVLQLNNVYADFKVTLEIYGMAAKRETLQHEQKYHINRKTPKGTKKVENRLKMPPIQSPGGPGAVRTPALCHYGFVIFSLREIQRNNWTLNQVSGVSPLQGTVHMKVNCELNVTIDHKGFLTMFEDVAGFGAWHRRWCRLRGHILSYWRYPDDEKKKAPMGSIDLRTCCTHKVAVAPRDVCARLNTLLLEMKRPILDTDKDSLVIVRHSKYTLVRHLLSADTKDERDKWCGNFNKALVLVRSWGSSNNSTASSV